MINSQKNSKKKSLSVLGSLVYSLDPNPGEDVAQLIYYYYFYIHYFHVFSPFISFILPYIFAR